MVQLFKKYSIKNPDHKQLVDRIVNETTEVTTLSLDPLDNPTPSLIDFDYQQLPAFKSPDFPYYHLRRNKSNLVFKDNTTIYKTEINLPENKFELTFHFAGQQRPELIEQKELKKQLISQHFAGSQAVQNTFKREICSFNHKFGHEALTQYLQQQDKNISKIAGFLSLYEAAPKSCQRDLANDWLLEVGMKDKGPTIKFGY